MNTMLSLVLGAGLCCADLLDRSQQQQITYLDRLLIVLMERYFVNYALTIDICLPYVE